MQSLTDIKSLLAERGLRPRHRFGQNFLHDQNLMRKLLDAANVQPGDLVLEVGPGTGSLTEALLDAGADVIACELDRDLAALLRERLGERITLIEGDAMDRGRSLNPQIVEALQRRDGDHFRGFKLVANLPYQVATSLITSLLIDHPQCIGQFVMVQLEVAQRLLATPAQGKEYGPLSIITQAFAHIELVAKAPASCFWPAPKVESALIAIHPRQRDDQFDLQDARAFAAFVVTTFSKRRKQLGTIFGRSRHDWPAPELGIDPALRPEALSVIQMIALWRAIGGSELR